MESGSRSGSAAASGAEFAAKTPLGAVFSPAYRRFSLTVLFFGIVTAAALAAAPLAQRMLIDSANAGLREETLRSAVALIVLFALVFVCGTLNTLLRFRLGVELRFRLQSAIFRRLLGMPEDLLRSRGSGYFFNRLQNDSAEVVRFGAGNALQQYEDLLKFLFAFAILSVQKWQFALPAIPFLLLHAAIYHRYRIRQYRLGHRIQERSAAEGFRMQEYLAGHATLKTHDAVEAASRRIDEGFARWRAIAFLRLFLENRFRFLLQLPELAFCGGVAAFGVLRVLDHAWTLGEVWALVVLIRQVFAPTRRIGLARFQMQSACAAWDRIRNLYRAGGDTGADAAETPCRALRGDIVLSQVDFAYREDTPLFRGLSLTVRGGDLCFLTGANGSGKSTLLLLLRLYRPSAGAITIGGVPVDRFESGSYRARIGYLGQTPEFFPGTIRENLLLGAVRSDEEIHAELARLNCEELVARRPGGLDAPVEERGGNFSGGERLRLALVREMLRDTDILLLDEAAANLDFEARAHFYSLLPRLRGSRTIIAVVHGEVPPELAAEPVFRLPDPAAR